MRGAGRSTQRSKVKATFPQISKKGQLVRVVTAPGWGGPRAAGAVCALLWPGQPESSGCVQHRRDRCPCPHPQVTVSLPVQAWVTHEKERGRLLTVTGEQQAETRMAGRAEGRLCGTPGMTVTATTCSPW